VGRWPARKGARITERTVDTDPNPYVYFDFNEGCPKFSKYLGATSKFHAPEG